MSIPKFYQLYCEDEVAAVTIWSTSEPTTCPNNPAHIITPESVSFSRNACSYYRSGYIKKLIDSDLPMEAASISWSGPIYAGNIIAVEVLCSHSDASDYVVRLVDTSNASIIATVTLDNTRNTINSLGEILYQPADKTILSLEAHRVGSTGIVNVIDAVIYTDLL